MKCPNKNYKTSEDQLFTDWEFLVGKFGEDQAYGYWLANNEEIPTPFETEQLSQLYVTTFIKKEDLIEGYNFLNDENGKLIPSKYIDQFVKSLTKLVFDIQNQDRKLSYKNVLKSIENELNVFYEFHKSINSKDKINEDSLDSGAFETVEQNQLVASYYKHILDNKERYFEMVTKSIESMGYSVSKNKTEFKINEEREQEDLQLDAENEFLSQEQVETEKRFSEGDGNMHQNPYTKLSPLIKRFISFIPAEEESVLGLQTYVPGQQVYSNLLSISSNKQYSYEELVQAIKENLVSKPYLQGVLDLLEEENQDVKIAFAKHFRHTYQTSKTLVIEDNEKSLKAKVIDTNRNSQVQLIREEWLNNSKLSNIFKGTAEGTFKDEEYISNELQRKWDNIFESQFSVESVKDFLDSIGIEMSNEALQYLKDSSQTTELKLKWESLFDSQLKNATIYKIFEYIKNINPKQNIEEDNPLAHESYITKLANIESLFKDSNNVTDNYKDGKGRSRYSHILPTWITNRYYELKDNKNGILDTLSNLPYSKFSYYVGKLKTNETFRKNFSVDLFDTTSNNDERLSFDEMSKREKLITQINLFINRQAGTKNERISTFLTPSKSDKTTLHSMTAVRYNVMSNSVDFKNKTFNINDKEALMNIVRGEYARIKDAQIKQSQGVNFKDIVGYNPFRFYFYESLNDIKDLWEYNEKGEKQLKNIDEVEDIVWEVVKQDTLSQIESLRSTLIKAGVIVDNKLEKIDTDYINDIKNNVDYFLADYIINYNIAKANYNMLFQGDTAFAAKKTVSSSLANMFKRLAKDVAPASRMAKFKDNADFNFYNQIFLEDSFSKSLNIDQLKSILGDRAEVYNQIEGTDAQELTTLEEHLDIMYYYSRLETDTYNKLITKAKKGQEYTEDELNVILQPIKPVYVGNKLMIEYGAEVPVYIKTSSFPLVPQLVQGTEFEKLEHQMRKNSIRRATFLTGAKLGAFKPIDIWNKVKDENGNTVEYDGKALTDGIINEEELEKGLKNKQWLTLNRDNFGIQQDVPYDPDKTTILEGSQLAKLIFHGLRGKDKEIKEFHDLHISITNKAFYDTLNKLGFVEENNNFIMKDMKKFQQMMIDELKEGSSTYTENDILALELNEDETDFKIPLWASVKSKQYEALLNSIINKKVLKTKLPGKSYVLGTEEGFKGKSPEINYIKEDKLTGTKYDPKTGLKPQRYGYVKGDIKLEEDEYKALNNKEGFTKVVFPAQIFVTKGNYNDKQIIGYRIPTQDLNSMSAMEIVGYLPNYMGDLLIASKDFTKQMGSDFDIDKIYTHRWYEDIKGKKYNEESIKKEWEILSESNQAKELKELIDLKDKVQIGQLLYEIFNKEELKYSEDEILELVENIHNQYPTEEQFFEKRKVKTDKNKIVDIYWNALIDVENLPAILNPLDNGNLPEAVKTIKKYQKETINHYLSPEYEVDNYENGNAGKFGVAATSLLSTFNSLVLSTNKDINITTPFNFEVYKDVTSLKNIKTLDNSNNKASVISAFQSASVDNIKELLIKTINYNNYTHDAFSALALLGLNDTYISYFLAQPSIKQYVEEIKNMNDSYSDPMSNLEKNNVILDKIANELIIQSQNKAKQNQTESTLTKDNVMSAIKSWNKSFSEDQLVKNLDGDNEYNQIVLLSKFLELSRVGKEINNIIRAISPATSGIGKDRLSATNKQGRLEEALTTEEITNVSSLLGYIEKDRIIPTTYIGNNLEILRKSNLMYNQFFKINDTASRLVDLIKLNRLSSKSLTEKEQSRVIDFLKSYIFSANLNIYGNKDVETYRKELLFGDNSLANRWKNFKKDNPYHFLANRIVTDISQSSVIPHTLSYRASIDDLEGDIKNIYELIEMLYSPNITTSTLAKDTIAYAYLSGGNQDSISLVKFIPISYLNVFEFGDHIHKLLDQVNLDIALEQYLQNNPHHAYTINKEDILSLEDNNLFISEDLFEGFDSDAPTYISYKEGNKWRIFKFNNDLYSFNKFGYTELDKLGTYSFVETKFDKSELTSSLKKKEEKPIQPPIESDEISGKKDLNDLENEIDTFNSIKSNKHFDFKVKEKYFSDNKIQTTKSVLEKISNSNHPVNTLAKQLLKYSDKLDTTIELVEDDDNNWAGQYIRKDNKIYIKANVSYSGFGVEPTILHEIIHALTVNEMRFNRDSNAVKDIRTLYEYAKKHINTEEYGLKDEYEFVAELFTNSSFINKLKDIPSTNIKEYKNFLQEFLNKVLALFGINKSNSLYEQAYAVASNIIENQYNKILLEKEFVEMSDVFPSDLSIFEELSNPELEEQIKKCK